MITKDAILLDEADHVATVLHHIEPGETVSIAGPGTHFKVIAKETIPIFHKVAVKPLPSGADVLKYSETIGTVITSVETGALMHVHNLRSKRAVSPRK